MNSATASGRHGGVLLVKLHKPTNKLFYNQYIPFTHSPPPIHNPFLISFCLNSQTIAMSYIRLLTISDELYILTENGRRTCQSRGPIIVRVKLGDTFADCAMFVSSHTHTVASRFVLASFRCMVLATCKSTITIIHSYIHRQREAVNTSVSSEHLKC